MIKLFTNSITLSELVNNIKTNDCNIHEYLKVLLHEYLYINMYSIIPNSIEYIYNFVPLPTKFLITFKNNEKVFIENNIYYFNNILSLNSIITDRIITSNNCPIPFTFPYYNKYNEIKILLSNVYYFEIKICDLKTDTLNYDKIVTDVFCIGFGSRVTPSNVLLGTINNTIGFYPLNGIIKYVKKKIITKIFINKAKVGDTIGSGVIYKGINCVIPFFTINDKIVYMCKKNIFILNSWAPIFSYSHNVSIYVNFFTEPFKYNIEDLIYQNSNIIYSTDNKFIVDGYNYSNKELTKINDITSVAIPISINTFLNNSLVNLQLALDSNVAINDLFNFAPLTNTNILNFNENSIDSMV